MKELDLIRKIVKQIDSITDHEITYRDVFDNTSSIVGTWSLRAGKETKAFWHPDNAKPSPTTEINVQSHHGVYKLLNLSPSLLAMGIHRWQELLNELRSISQQPNFRPRAYAKGLNDDDILSLPSRLDTDQLEINQAKRLLSWLQLNQV